MDWLSFFVGVLVGWIAELIIDYLFWQKRIDALRTENEGLRADLRRLKNMESRYADLQAELALLQDVDAKNAELTAALATCQEQLQAWDEKMTTREAMADEFISTRSEPVAFADMQDSTSDASFAAAPDDLKVIEGIGPQIARILNEAGISTYVMLAETKVALLRDILEEAGPRFRLADPQTWPEQARLAARGDWDALKALQDTLMGGRL